MSTFEQMDITNVGDGTLAEAFSDAVAAILSDLDDPTKDPKADRRITAAVIFKPDGSGNLTIHVECNPVLPKRRPWRSIGYVDREGIHQLRNTQEELPFNVTPLNQKEAPRD